MKLVVLVVVLVFLSSEGTLAGVASADAFERGPIDVAMKDNADDLLHPKFAKQRKEARQKVEAVCDAMPWGADGRPRLPPWVLSLPPVKMVRNLPEAAHALLSRAQQVLARRDTAGGGATSFLELPEPVSGDHAIWEDTNFLHWTIVADTNPISSSCALSYLVSYLSSWFACVCFMAFAINHGADYVSYRGGEGRTLMQWGVAAVVSSLVFAVMGVSCTAPSSTCFHKTRRVFNFIWPGLILTAMGYYMSYEPQDRDKDLEDYVLKRQLLRDKRLQGNEDYATNLLYNKHKEAVKLSEQLLDYTTDAGGAVDFDGTETSLVLKPSRRSPRSALELFKNPLALIGQLIVVVVVAVMFFSCGYTKRIDDSLGYASLG